MGDTFLFVGLALAAPSDIQPAFPATQTPHRLPFVLLVGKEKFTQTGDRFIFVHWLNLTNVF